MDLTHEQHETSYLTSCRMPHLTAGEKAVDFQVDHSETTSMLNNQVEGIFHIYTCIPDSQRHFLPSQ